MKRTYQNLQATATYRALLGDLSALPFSFTYNGRDYRGFSKESFALKRKDVMQGGEKETQRLTFAFADVLEITLILTHYFSHGVTEWTVWFENVSDTDSGVLEDLKTELIFKGKYPALKGILGDHVNQYSPYCIDLQGRPVEFSADTGRASYLPCLNFSSRFAQDPNGDFRMLRFGLTEWKKIAPYLLGEFYPLTPWHKEKDNTDFTAYCYFDPEKEEGVLLAFRQEECRREQLSLSLPFANGGEDYTLIDEDSGEKIQTKGSFALRFDRPRTARLLWVSKP